MDAMDDKLREYWDRLTLLLIADPSEGWEPEFEEIKRREIERLTVPFGKASVMSSSRVGAEPASGSTLETSK